MSADHEAQFETLSDSVFSLMNSESKYVNRLTFTDAGAASRVADEVESLGRGMARGRHGDYFYLWIEEEA